MNDCIEKGHAEYVPSTPLGDLSALMGVHRRCKKRSFNVLRKFISAHGCAQQVRSDRGTNFISANKDLKEAIENRNLHNINEFIGQKVIEWILHSPTASDMSGAGEHMVRSLKQRPL